MQSTRSALQTLHTLSRALPSTPSPVFSSQRRHASFSLSSLRDLLPRRKKDNDSTPEASPVNTAPTEQPKGLFDSAVEEEEVLLSRQDSYQLSTKKPTFHKSSTANFKTSKRKLNDLARLVAGRTADEALLQLQATQKKQAPRLLSMIALARDHAVAKGLRREKLVIAQSWVTKGPALARLDIKGRGRHGIKHHPSSKLHVLLAEGETKEQLRRQKKQDQWRSSLRGLTQIDGVGLGKSRPVINAGVGGWKW
ncbi:mitochondrial 54S ribosomal protein uL22m MRPL22 [Sporobolomyces salmoneus]|uniref:mitochondrial 54S ribosomal protein uL22m MRPL22 n=1 Tax=Sporobolomyces salmoneus TaxID=183962 RepID=UPI003178B65A